MGTHPHRVIPGCSPEPAHRWEWVPGSPCLLQGMDQDLLSFGGSSRAKCIKKKNKQKNPCFLCLFQSGGQGRGEMEVRSCRPSGVHILAGLMTEEEGGLEIKQEFGKTNSSNSHCSAAGEKSQHLLDLGKGSSSPTNCTTPLGICTSGSFYY